MTNQDPSPRPDTGVEELGIKNKTEEQLFGALLETGQEWTDEQKGVVVAAYNLARFVHKDDEHRDLPYTYHLLRNANRAMGYLKVTDPEIIAAIILHDSVEDHPDEIIKASVFGSTEPLVAIPVPQDPMLKQQTALKTLEVLFSPKVAGMVAAVTNPPSSEHAGLTYEERLEKYANKVTQAVVTAEGWIIKFVDWIDNGLGIIHNEQPLDSPGLQHFVRKYSLVQPIFEERYHQPDIQALLSPSAKAYVAHQFVLGKERLNTDSTS